MAINVEISGAYACFSRPELKVERVSYDVITPSAVRGILEAVFWKPAIRYVINEIRVCSPIKFDNIRRNEVKSKASPGRERIYAADDRTQRAAMVLKDVRYVVNACFQPTERVGSEDRLPDGGFNHGKFAEMITRRLRSGQHFHQPYLGTREFPAVLRLIEPGEALPEAIREDRDLGLMLYDIDYEKTADHERVTAFTPTYFRAEMVQGVIDLRNVKVLR